jgi:sec-independent protein translocase protein TatB
MFDIGWSELLVIGIVALVVIGPKELPGVLRGIGQMMSKVRRMASEFQGQFNEAMREAELEDLRKQAEKLNMTVNPLEGMKDAVAKPFEDVAKDLQAPLDAPKIETPAATSAPVPMDEIKPAEAMPSSAPKSSGGSA